MVSFCFCSPWVLAWLAHCMFATAASVCTPSCARCTHAYARAHASAHSSPSAVATAHGARGPQEADRLSVVESWARGPAQAGPMSARELSTGISHPTHTHTPFFAKQAILAQHPCTSYSPPSACAQSAAHLPALPAAASRFGRPAQGGGSYNVTRDRAVVVAPSPQGGWFCCPEHGVPHPCLLLLLLNKHLHNACITCCIFSHKRGVRTLSPSVSTLMTPSLYRLFTQLARSPDPSLAHAYCVSLLLPCYHTCACPAVAAARLARLQATCTVRKLGR